MNGAELAIAMQSGYEQGYKDGAIAELEKIKAEIRENVFCYDKEQIIRLIIDKHISELKGEKGAEE